MTLEGNGILKTMAGDTLCKARYTVLLGERMQGKQVYTFNGDAPILTQGKHETGTAILQPEGMDLDPEVRELILVTTDDRCFHLVITSSPLEPSVQARATEVDCP